MTESRIIVTRRWPHEVEQQLLERYDDVRLNLDDLPMDQRQLQAALRDYDIVLPCVSDRLGGDLFLDGNLRCRFIGNFGVGYDNIDIAAAATRDIVVTNTPGVLTDATADAAMTLLLMVARRAGEGERELRSGSWVGWRPTHMMGADITGKTLGILGMGRIGRAVAKRAHFGFGMRVLYFDTSAVVDLEFPTARAGSIDEVLAEADFVSLHMPGGGDNSHLIDGRRLALMKCTAYLINTARGDLIDEDALVSALADHAIAGAGLDVFQGEPQVNPALCRLENAVLFPHLGSATRETRIAMGNLVLDNLNAFMTGENPPCRVA